MATDLMPSSLQAQITRRAISPRLAIRIFLNMRRVVTRYDCSVAHRRSPGAGPTFGKRTAASGARANGEQRLTIFNRLVIADKCLDHLARYVRLDFVHQLHGLDDAEHLADLHQVSWLYKRRRSRRGCLVERAHDGGIDGVQPGFAYRFHR